MAVAIGQQHAWAAFSTSMGGLRRRAAMQASAAAGAFLPLFHGAAAPQIGALGARGGTAEGAMLSSTPYRVKMAITRVLPAAGRRGLTHKAMTRGGSSEEMVALARLARTNTTPYRVVLKLGNTNIKAAIVDDRRDLTVRPLPGGNTVAPRVHCVMSPTVTAMLCACCIV